MMASTAASTAPHRDAPGKHGAAAGLDDALQGLPLPAFTPSATLTLHFGGKPVAPGARVSTAAAVSAPTLTVEGVDPNATYTCERVDVGARAHARPRPRRRAPTTLASRVTSSSSIPHPTAVLVADPDAPRPDAPAARWWLHWLVAGVPGAALAAGGDVDVAAAAGASELVPYAGPTPPAGVHRYVFLLACHEGAGGSAMPPVRMPKARGHFDVAGWLRDHDLAPVAVAHFTAEAGC